jgi:hypothetical protein
VTMQCAKAGLRRQGSVRASPFHTLVGVFLRIVESVHHHSSTLLPCPAFGSAASPVFRIVRTQDGRYHEGAQSRVRVRFSSQPGTHSHPRKPPERESRRREDLAQQLDLGQPPKDGGVALARGTVPPALVSPTWRNTSMARSRPTEAPRTANKTMVPLATLSIFWLVTGLR